MPHATGPASSGADAPRRRATVGPRGWPRWPLLLGALVVGALAASVVVPRGGPPPVQPPVPESLVGRLDVASGRSSTQPPPADLRERWATTLSRPVDGPPWQLTVATVGDDLAIVGDRVLSLSDGGVVAPSAAAFAVPATMEGVARARAGWVAQGRLVTVDAVLGTVLADVAVEGGIDSYGFVAGFVGDVAVVLTWPDGEQPLVTGVDTTTGEQEWRVAGDLWAPVGDGWFVGQRTTGSGRPQGFLLDGRTGGLVDHPDLVTSELGPDRIAVLDDEVAWLVDDGVVVTDLATGERRWERPVGDARRVARAGGALRVESFDWGTATVTVRWYGATDGEPLGSVTARLPERGGVDPDELHAPVGQDALVVATDDGITLVERDGPGWSVALDDVLLVRSVGADDRFVVAVSGRRAAGRDRFVGRLTATIVAGDGRVLHTVPVAPLTYGRSWDVVGLVEGDVLLAPARRSTLDQVVGVALDDGELLTSGEVVEALAGDVVGETYGSFAAAGAEYVGVVAGGPGGGGPAPVVLHRGGLGVLVPRHGFRAGAPPAPEDGRVVTAAGGRLAVPTDEGTTLVALPGPGEGAPVGAVVGRAVGATDAAAVAEVAATPVVAVPGVTPLAGIGDVLVATSSTGSVEPWSRPAAGDGTVVGVDALDGRVLWRSELALSRDAAGAWFGAGGDLGQWLLSGVVGTDDGAVVLALDDEVVALDLDDGAVRWRVPLRLGDVAPVLVDGLVVVATPTAVLGLERATGRRVWQHEAGDLVTALDGAGDVVLLGTATGTVRVLDADGATTDEVATAQRVDDLAVVDDLVLVVHVDGTVSAFGPPPTSVDSRDAVDVGVPATRP